MFFLIAVNELAITKKVEFVLDELKENIDAIPCDSSMNNSSAEISEYTFTMESGITTLTIVEDTSVTSSDSSIYPETGEVTTQNVFLVLSVFCC